MQHQRIPDERRGTRLSEDEIDNTVAAFCSTDHRGLGLSRRSRANSATGLMPKTQ